jgi:hypothetical protein
MSAFSAITTSSTSSTITIDTASVNAALPSGSGTEAQEPGNSLQYILLAPAEENHEYRMSGYNEA